MTDERIINYLLKELPEEELEQFEDECFAQERWPSQLNHVEADLIDDYLRGELPPERRRRFELNYLTTEARRNRVVLAAALLRRVDELTPHPDQSVVAPPARHGWLDRSRTFWKSRGWKPQAAAAALASAFIIAGLWWFASPRRQADPAHSATKIFEPLVLHISHGNRAAGGEAGKAKLPRGGVGLKIFLTLPQPSAPATGYRVQLENEDGEIKLSEKVVREDQTVTIEIPAGSLTRGRYAVKLFAAGDDGTEQRIPGHYFFDVE